MNSTYIIILNFRTGVEDIIIGYATPVGENGEAKLIVTFPSVGE